MTDNEKKQAFELVMNKINELIVIVNEINQEKQDISPWL